MQECSSLVSSVYRLEITINHDVRKGVYMKERPSIDYYKSRTFSCKQCHQIVTTIEGAFDRRLCFCSTLCSRRYWRHPSKYKKID